MSLFKLYKQWLPRFAVHVFTLLKSLSLYAIHFKHDNKSNNENNEILIT